MKRIIFFLLISILANCKILAIESYMTPNGPTHALYPGNVRLTADTIYYIPYVLDNWAIDYTELCELWGAPNISSIVITRSQDGLTDTIKKYPPVFDDNYRPYTIVKRYDEKNRMMYEMPDYLTYIPPEGTESLNRYVNTKREYEYDEYDRIIKITSKVIYYLLNEEKTEWIETFDYSTIVETEKGYIYMDREYELDDLNRLVSIKNLNPPKEYFENGEYMELDGKKYRVGDAYYVYIEGGVIALTYQKTSYWALGWLDRWVKTEILFSEKGRFITKAISYDGENWEITNQGETRYAWTSKDSDEVLSEYSGESVKNETLDYSGTKVFGFSCSIIINTGGNAQVSIYNTTGKLVSKQQVYAGTNKIYVSEKGIYFVIVNTKSHKVFVN